MNSSEAAETVVKMALEGTEVAIKVIGEESKNLAMLLLALANEKKNTKGKVKLNNMLKSNEPLKIFSLKKDDLKKFSSVAKEYGVPYTVLANKKDKANDGVVDLLVKADDSIRVNRIIERFKLVDIATIKSEIEKDKIDAMEKEALANGVDIIKPEEQLVNEIIIDPNNKGEKDKLNPDLAMTEKSPLSEHSSKNKNKTGVVSSKKESVKKKLEKIKNELKTKSKEIEKNKNKSRKKSKKKVKGR